MKTQRIFQEDDLYEELANELVIAESDECFGSEDTLRLVLQAGDLRASQENYSLMIEPWDNPELKQDEMIKLLKDSPFINDVTVDNETIPTGKSLSLLLTKANPIETKEWLDKVVEGLRIQVHEIHEFNLGGNIEGNANLKHLIAFLLKEDHVVLNLKPEDERDMLSDTLIPHDTRKLSMLDETSKKTIIDEFMKTFEKPSNDVGIIYKIVSKIAFMLDNFDMKSWGKMLRIMHSLPFLYL